MGKKALALGAILIILAIATLVPNAGASKACMLGYKAVCSFTPASTVILLVVGIALLIKGRGSSTKTEK